MGVDITLLRVSTRTECIHRILTPSTATPPSRDYLSGLPSANPQCLNFRYIFYFVLNRSEAHNLLTGRSSRGSNTYRGDHLTACQELFYKTLYTKVFYFGAVVRKTRNDPSNNTQTSRSIFFPANPFLELMNQKYERNYGVGMNEKWAEVRNTLSKIPTMKSKVDLHITCEILYLMSRFDDGYIADYIYEHACTLLEWVREDPVGVIMRTFSKNDSLTFFDMTKFPLLYWKLLHGAMLKSVLSMVYSCNFTAIYICDSSRMICEMNKRISESSIEEGFEMDQALDLCGTLCINASGRNSGSIWLIESGKLASSSCLIDADIVWIDDDRVTGTATIKSKCRPSFMIKTR